MSQSLLKFVLVCLLFSGSLAQGQAVLEPDWSTEWRENRFLGHATVPSACTDLQIFRALHDPVFLKKHILLIEKVEFQGEEKGTFAVDVKFLWFERSIRGSWFKDENTSRTYIVRGGAFDGAKMTLAVIPQSKTTVVRHQAEWASAKAGDLSWLLRTFLPLAYAEGVSQLKKILEQCLLI